MIWPLVAIAVAGWLAVPLAVGLVVRSRARRERQLVDLLRRGIGLYVSRQAQESGLAADPIPSTESDVGIAIAHLDTIAQRILHERQRTPHSIATSDTIPIDVGPQPGKPFNF